MTEKNKDIGKGQGSRAGKSGSFEFSSKLQEILADHHLWLESQGKDGKQANLSGWDLSGLDLAERDLRDVNFEDVQLAQANLSWAELDRANLSGANLKEADLSRAHLQGADLRHANLEKADLTAANLRNARLQGANFQETNVLKADFRDADLQDTKLSQSHDLLSWQLAGANLTAADLPGNVSRFEELAHSGEITKTTATLLWTLLTGCLYATLTVATTTDASFYVSAATLKLPIIDAVIPTWGFFVLAPIVLLGWYFYFLLNLQRLWEALITLPALFPDGMRLDQKAAPWFITGLVCSYFPQLQSQKPAFLRTQKFLSLVLVWWIVPLTLIFIWIVYLKARFWPIALVQILAIGLAIFLGCRTWQVAKSTLRAETPRPPKKDLAYSLVAVAILVLLSVEIINLVPPRLEPELAAEYESQQKFGPIVFGLNGYYLYKTINASFPTIGRIIDWVFSRPFVNIDYEEVSFKPKGSPEDWDKLTDPELRRYLERVKGARLRYTNLRHGHAARVFLAKANLANANLAGAYLHKADLRNADLSGAYLFNAFLSEAYLQEANLQQANLRSANLRYAKFDDADLKGADLKGANLEGADFRKAQGLTGDQIKAARNWPLAFYSRDLLSELELPANHNRLFLERNLSRYYLQRVDLAGANLAGCNLEGAQLQEANLQDANLSGANLTGADLERARLKGADLKGANLAEVKNLTRKQLESADYKDKNTRLPDYLK
jgi:uncharacterized protein YjbI with pentapeptide repeats